MYSQQRYAISHFICLQKWIKSHSRRSSGIMEGLKLLSLSSAGAKSAERLNMTGYDSIFATSFPLQSSLSFAEPQLAFCVDFLFLRRGTEPEHHRRHKPLLCSVQRSLWCPGWCHNFNFSRGFLVVACCCCSITRRERRVADRWDTDYDSGQVKRPNTHPCALVRNALPLSGIVCTDN